MKPTPLKRLVFITLATTGLTLVGADLVSAQRTAETTNQHSPARSNIKNVATTQGLEVVARLPERPQAAVTLPNGRIIYVLHRTAQSPVKLLEFLPNGQSRPFPTPEIARMPVQMIRITPDGQVWMILRPGEGEVPKLIGWDLNKNAVFKEISIPAPAFEQFSVFQDFVIDSDRNMLYIADPRGGQKQGQINPAIVAVNLNTGAAKRWLAGHSSVQPGQTTMQVEGQTLVQKTPDGKTIPARFGVNGIAIDPALEWVYFGPMTGSGMYRVKANDLANFKLSERELGNRVERYGNKGSAGDGILVDVAGNVYNSDMPASGIGVTDASGQYRLLLQDKNLFSFPDTLAVGYDGFIYGTVTQAHRSTFYQPQDRGTPPYYIYRFKPLAPITVNAG